jgi:hypothetical protein
LPERETAQKKTAGTKAPAADSRPCGKLRESEDSSVSDNCTRSASARLRMSRWIRASSAHETVRDDHVESCRTGWCVAISRIVAGLPAGTSLAESLISGKRQRSSAACATTQPQICGEGVRLCVL